MFDLHGTERLNEWKRFRDNLEVSSTPYQDVVDLWSRAPFVNPYLDPNNPTDWPDPWHLVLDNRLDDLAIALGMLYTIKLTRRFMDSSCEIHTSVEQKENRFILLVDNEFVLNWEFKKVKRVENLNGVETRLLWLKK